MLAEVETDKVRCPAAGSPRRSVGRSEIGRTLPTFALTPVPRRPSRSCHLYALQATVDFQFQEDAFLAKILVPEGAWPAPRG